MIKINGKKVSKQIYCEILENKDLDSKIKPRLDIILIGNDYSSFKYVQYKMKACKDLHFDAVLHKFDLIDKDDLINLIDELNHNQEVNGIMIQLPLSGELCSFTAEILNVIDPAKDVDGLTESNIGNLLALVDIVKNEKFNSKIIILKNDVNVLKSFIPATSLAFLKCIEHYKIDLKNKKIAVVGASNIVGLPISILSAIERGYVEMFDENSKNYEEYLSQADVVVSATGKPNLIRSKSIKEGAIVFDIGFYFDTETGKVIGDIEDTDKNKFSYYSPPVGGIGPVTVACLLLNTYNSWKNNKLKETN